MKHIPKGESTKEDILLFNEALERSLKAECDYDTDKWLYVPNFYSEYRYILGTKGDKPLITIGINPSTAAPDALDNTLKSVERIALANGFDSFIMFNVYAERATDPDHMDRVFNERLHLENMKAFRYTLGLSKERPVIWAAWGNIIAKRDYLKRCVSDMIKIAEEFDARFVKAGPVSKAGHPHHPLYLKSDTPVEDFEVKTYLNNL